MARIPLTSTFSLVPEGRHVFLITGVKYDETWGKLEIKMVTQNGQTHIERFTLKDANDEPNEKALGAFSYFAKTAMNDFSATDIDPDDLVGYYIGAEVVHTKLPSRNDPNKTVTFANLSEKWAASNFDGVEDVPETEANQTNTPNVDLDALLD